MKSPRRNDERLLLRWGKKEEAVQGVREHRGGLRPQGGKLEPAPTSKKNRQKTRRPNEKKALQR